MNFIQQIMLKTTNTPITRQNVVTEIFLPCAFEDYFRFSQLSEGSFFPKKI